METFIGEHDGIEMFTIGQRKGLPGGSPRPRYVVDLDPATNRVVVGDADDLVCDEFEIDRVNWHPVAAGGDRGAFEATVKIRYNHPGTPRQLRHWRTIARMCDCMSLSARSHRDKLRSFTTARSCLVAAGFVAEKRSSRPNRWLKKSCSP